MVSTRLSVHRIVCAHRIVCRFYNYREHFDQNTVSNSLVTDMLSIDNSIRLGNRVSGKVHTHQID